MRALIALAAVMTLACVGYAGAQVSALHPIFTVVVPYAALALFIGGFVYRVISWARSPVPFRITTTCGQQKSLDWIPSSRLDNPHTTWGVIGRMALEVLCFRSLLRDTKAELHHGEKGVKVAYGDNIWLWAAGLAMHWAFLLVVLRHLRFFVEPVPSFVLALQELDGFMEIGKPTVLITGVVLLVAASYLFLRRLYSPQLRYISLVADYFPLFLILFIGLTGVMLRYFFRTDVTSVKELTLSLASFHPRVHEGLHWLFYVHFFLVCVLLAYFPFSKLMHMGGVFLSPTRNLANDNRMRRHVNPWAEKAKVYPYAKYEDEFRTKMIEAGIPVERDLVTEEK